MVLNARIQTLFSVVTFGGKTQTAENRIPSSSSPPRTQPNNDMKWVLKTNASSENFSCLGEGGFQMQFHHLTSSLVGS